MEALFELTKEITPENLDHAMQQAINLEIATIPTYLYTYYSIKRSWEQVPEKGQKLSEADKLRERIRMDAETGGTPVSEKEAHDMSVEIQVYANKAAALIMSVVVEEMLHTSLSSNVKQAIFGPPQLYKNIPGSFPAYLPGHVPYFPINLSKFSQDQLKTFLLIESPRPFTEGGPERGTDVVEYQTIGRFYQLLENCVLDNFPGPYQSGRPQLVPGKGFYAQNTINTIYYDKDHKPQFPDADDGGDLVHVLDCDSAIKAMQIVVEQGEGHHGGSVLKPDGEPDSKKIDFDNPGKIPQQDYDDAAHEELAHFDKFLELYCEGDRLIKKFSDKNCDFHSYFVHPVPDNPKTRPDGKSVSYEGHPELQAVSNLINALYSYLFIMVEACYYKSGNTQYEVFMFGVHKTMIWALSSLCNSVTSWKFKHGDRTYHMAPTFEPYDFAENTSPKRQILALLELCPASGPHNVAWAGEYIKNLPDVSLNYDMKVAM